MFSAMRRETIMTILAQIVRPMAPPGTESGRSDASGFSLIDMLLTLILMGLVTGIFMASLFAALSGVERESNRAVNTSKGRSGMEMLTQILRNDVVQINVASGTSLGVNFDLNEDDAPGLRDGVLFYIDEDGSGRLTESEEAGAIEFAGLDDTNGDGQADLIGIALLPQYLNGVRSIVDIDKDGQADDIDGDGNADPLWQMVMRRFENIGQTSDLSRWKAGLILVRDLYPKKIDPEGELTGANIDTIQYRARNSDAMASDTDSNGLVEEHELGSIASKDGIINSAVEVASIDTIRFRLHVAQVTEGLQAQKTVLTRDLSTEVAPRPLMLLRRNGIVGSLDAKSVLHID